MNTPAKILLVDDNPVVLLNLSRLLKSAGYEVSEAASGGEGLRLALKAAPDLALLDVMLPDVDGVKLCRQIKSCPELAATHVALLSSIQTSSDRQASGLEAGADSYIIRPIENRELLARVQAMLRIQQAEAALRRSHEELEKRVQERTAELSEANVRLRALSRRLVEVQEEERRFLARELHDEIGQVLTGLKLSLEMTSSRAGELACPRLAEPAVIIDELMERVRRLSLDLRPQMLDDLGLCIALDWHFQRYTRQTGLRVHFQTVTPGGRLETALETGVFRIVQEALTNVARYAGVKEVRVRLWSGEGKLHLQVEDKGAGFDLQRTLAARTSSGLTGMKERAELLGGEFQVESSPGHGTRLTVALPLRTMTAKPAACSSELP